MRKLLKFLGWTIGILVVVGVVLRLALFDSWTIPDDDPVLAAGIAPTLRGGDSVLVLTAGSPGFGDLVRCKDPDNPGHFVVGRIVGTDNDLVRVEGRMLRVNGTLYNESDACQEPFFSVEHPTTGATVELGCSRVQMGGGWHMRGVVRGPFNQEGVEQRVAPGKLYLLSDNRDLHDDSRDFGQIAREDCDGRIVFRLWSKAGWSDSAARLSGIH